MSEMDVEAILTESLENNPSERRISWGDHIDSAVREFLKTAVVIDNEPVLQSSAPYEKTLATPAVRDSGMGDDVVILNPPEEASPLSGNGLDVRGISDEFASNGIACAFVLPDDADAHYDKKIERAVAAARVADLVIIDWYLQRQDSSLTLQILKRLASGDSAENGRLRLICVYTGEPLNSGILEDVKSTMATEGLHLEDAPGRPFSARGESTIVVLLSKSETRASDLPSELIGCFGDFANGIMPSFALAAVGAIRKSAHHMLTRFGTWLDPAYVANYAITNPRADVPQMLRELLVAECDTALGLEGVADRYLDKAPILSWLEARKPDLKEEKDGKLTVNSDLIEKIVRGDIKNDSHFIVGGEDFSFPQVKRWRLSSVLAGSKENAIASEHEFARLVSLKREAHGRSNLHSVGRWNPSLTTGTILSYVPTGGAPLEYLVCLTPACDTLRLREESSFVFLKATLATDQYGIVLVDASKAETRLQTDPKRPFIRTFKFQPEPKSQRILGLRSKDGDFSFLDVEGNSFAWLGEIRYARAASEAASMLGNWMRIGVSDSEYLRLSSQGKFKELHVKSE